MSRGLKLEHISKAFHSTRVLEDVTLDVQPGEFISLVGPSGCGKSTLLRIIAGLEFQDSGHVLIGDDHVDGLGPRARNIAMVFQNYALYPHMSAFENIAVPLSMARLSLFERLPLIRYLSPRRPAISRGITSEVNAVAAQLKIEPLLHRKPAQLSGGQRQRVALARAMVRHPTLFLMDEPLSNLDAQLRVHMRDELAELHARLGVTFIYVTHDQVEAMTMSNRVAMMDGGRLVQVGKPSELYERPATLAVARFIGSPALNLLSATVDSLGRISYAGKPLGVSTANGPGAVTVGVRPEAIRLAAVSNNEHLTGRVRRSEHHGAERLIYVDLNSPSADVIIARVSLSDGVGNQPEPGTDVSIGIDPRWAHVFAESGDRIDSKALSVGAVESHSVMAAE